MLEQTDGLFETVRKLKAQAPEGGILTLAIPENSPPPK